MSHPRRVDRVALLALAGYFLLTVILTYPLALHFGSHVIGTNVDEGTFLWNLWWVRHALLDLGTSPFYTDWIFFPVGIGLVSYTLAPANAILSLPVQLLAGPIVAENAVTWASFTLSAFGAFLLAREVLRGAGVRGPGARPEPDPARRAGTHPQGGCGAPLPGEAAIPPAPGPRTPDFGQVDAASFVAGLIFAFPASRFVYAALGQANLTSTAWIPFYALGLVRGLRASQGRSTRAALVYGALAGLAFALATYSELTYASFLALLAVPLVAGAAVRGARAGARFWGRFVAGLVAQLLVAGLLLAPLLLAVARESGGEAFARGPMADAERFSADLLSFFTPTALHPVFGSVGRSAAARFTDVPIVYLGFSVVVLALVGAWARRRGLWPWWLGAAGFWALTLGPVLHVNGTSQFNVDGLPLTIGLPPGLALYQVPLFNANRVPNRFSIMLSLCLSVLVAAGLAYLGGRLVHKTRAGLRRWPAYALCALAAGAVLFEHLSLPLPLNDARAPAVYAMIAAEPGDFAVLTLPLGWRNSYGIQGQEKTIIQSFQAVHGKRLLGGNTSRNPAFKFAYYARLPVIRSVIALEEGRPLPADAEAVDRAAAGTVLSFFDIRYLVVHRAYVAPGVEDYLLRVLPLEKFYEEGDVASYHVPAAARAPVSRLDLGTPVGDLALGEGWGEDEAGAGVPSLNWATAPRAELFLPVTQPPPGRLVLRALPFSYAGGPAQTVRLTLDGRPLADLTLAPAWHEYAVDLPTLPPGIHRLTLDFAYAASPSRVLGTPDQRTLAAALDELRLEP